jgi:2-phosphosulfolactate phosphatase
MEFEYTTLDTCANAKNTVVVIDVLRAFSTAAYAFAAGAEEIYLVRGVKDALELKAANPGALVMGEIGGIKVEGFDFGNSPAEFLNIDLSGKTLIQRTSAGTQGIVRSKQAATLLAASFCVAGATVRFLQQEASELVTFVITGSGPGAHGDEDRACAQYLETLLRGEQTQSETFRQRVLLSPSGQNFSNPELPDDLSHDLELCMQVDRFNFAMLVKRTNGLFVMRPI